MKKLKLKKVTIGHKALPVAAPPEPKEVKEQEPFVSTQTPNGSVVYGFRYCKYYAYGFQPAYETEDEFLKGLEKDFAGVYPNIGDLWLKIANRLIAHGKVKSFNVGWDHEIARLALRVSTFETKGIVVGYLKAIQSGTDWKPQTKEELVGTVAKSADVKDVFGCAVGGRGWKINCVLEAAEKPLSAKKVQVAAKLTKPASSHLGWLVKNGYAVKLKKEVNGKTIWKYDLKPKYKKVKRVTPPPVAPAEAEKPRKKKVKKKIRK